MAEQFTDVYGSAVPQIAEAQSFAGLEDEIAEGTSHSGFFKTADQRFRQPALDRQNQLAGHFIGQADQASFESHYADHLRQRFL